MRKWLILLLALLLAGCGADKWPQKNPYTAEDFVYDGQWLECISGEAVRGIDVSTHQGDIDWEKVAAQGVEFAMIRVGYRGAVEGEINEDRRAHTNIQGALDAGLDVGIYFFSQALSVEEAVEEADYVLDFIAGYDITMPVVFDWEHVEREDARTAQMKDRSLLTACAKAFTDVVAEGGYRPMVYFNRYQATLLLDLKKLEGCGLWFANYDAPMNFQWKLDMWQYSDHGTLDGISEKVDLNLYFPPEA